MRRIGEEVTEQIEYTPASLFVIEHVQPKYAPDCAACPQRATCPDCDIAEPAVVRARRPGYRESSSRIGFAAGKLTTAVTIALLTPSVLVTSAARTPAA